MNITIEECIFENGFEAPETKRSFIEVDETGSVEIKHGLIFHCCGTSIFIHDQRFAPDLSFVASGLCLYNGCPRWWQLTKWWKIVQLIRRYTRPVP